MRPITGYYFEFGCHSARTMRMAYDALSPTCDLRYVAFDSFQGMPPVEKAEQTAVFFEGNLCTTEGEFVETCLRWGIPRERLTTVKGFYRDVLNDETKQKFLPEKAAVINIDCDLYESSIYVLKFSKDFLRKGTVVIFDDWNVFFSDPNKGQRRAFREFLEENPDLAFVPFVGNQVSQAFIFLGDKASFSESVAEQMGPARLTTFA